MKRTSLITTTALIAGLMAAPALAVDLNAGGKVSAGAQVGENGVDAATTASTSSDANFGKLISSLNANAKTAADIQTMTEFSSVKVVNVSDLEAGANAAAVNNAMTKNAEGRTELQAAIDANAALKAELEQQSVEVSSVVAADVGADGSLIVFVQ